MNLGKEDSWPPCLNTDPGKQRRHTNSLGNLKWASGNTREVSKKPFSEEALEFSSGTYRVALLQKQSPVSKHK